MGRFIPNMGIGAQYSSALADALFSPVQQRVIGLLFGQPNRQFQSAELIRLAASGTGAVHRYLQQLAVAGLIVALRQGNQKYYQANQASPVFHELHGLVMKTVGLAEPIRDALGSIKKELRAAFVFGSIADGTERASSDVDLLLISDKLSYAEVFDAVQPAERVLGRSINPVLMSYADWRIKRKTRQSFAARVHGGPKVFVVGSESDIA